MGKSVFHSLIAEDRNDCLAYFVLPTWFRLTLRVRGFVVFILFGKGRYLKASQLSFFSFQRANVNLDLSWNLSGGIPLFR